MKTITWPNVRWACLWPMHAVYTEDFLATPLDNARKYRVSVVWPARQAQSSCQLYRGTGPQLLVVFTLVCSGFTIFNTFAYCKQHLQ